MIPNIIAERQARQFEEVKAVLRTKNIGLSKAVATKIVGGRYTLEKLIETKRIRTTQREDGRGQFRRYDCNAADVLEYANYKERIC